MSGTKGGGPPPSPRPPEVIAITGPTASGKSELAIELAQRLDGEVIGADAYQLYRGMDIGTAKVPVEQRRGIAHHLVDVLEVRDEATIADYQVQARAAIEDVLARGRVPILVGGSGLYVRAAVDHLDIPPTDPTVRARLEARALADGGPEALRARLHAVDPVAARAIEPRNLRRIIRALEVIEVTGAPFSATAPTKRYIRPTLVVGLQVPREELVGRIDARVEQMWRDGLVQEVRGLVDAGLRSGRTASRAIGYAQALEQIDGRCDEAAAIASTAQATRRYARRQESWWRPDHRVRWIEADRADLLGEVLRLAEEPAHWGP